MNLIKILIADDMEDFRSNVKRMLNTQSHLSVVGEAKNGQETIELAKELKPHIILMDINMPEVDGLKATEILHREFPNIFSIIMSIQGEQEYFRRAMKAGAKDFLVKPFSTSDLVDTINNVYQSWIKEKAESGELESNAEIVTFFSTKGGVGKTTLAVNLAASLALRGKKTLLVDASLQFGDVAITLNQNSRKTIHNISELEKISYDDIQRNLVKHSSGMDMLLAPREPVFAEAVKTAHIKTVIDLVRPVYQYVVFDMPPAITEKELLILDKTDLLLLVATLEITSLKNTKLCLKTFKDIGFETNRVKLILNKDISNVGISKSDLEKGLAIPVFSVVPMEAEIAQRSLNQGESFVVKSPESNLSRAVENIADKIIGVVPKNEVDQINFIDRIKSLFFQGKK